MIMFINLITNKFMKFRPYLMLHKGLIIMLITLLNLTLIDILHLIISNITMCLCIMSKKITITERLILSELKN